jgi:hypothetical protein
MGDFKSLKFGVLAAAAIGVAAITNGCSATSNPLGSVCCSAFKPGTDMLGASFTGDANANAQLSVLAQGVGDLSAVAEGAVSDVQAACLAIAMDLGDTNTPPAGTEGTALMNFWCGEATTKIKAALSAGVTLNIAFDPPACSASISVQGDCQAHCNVNGMCNIQANPPTCMGGQLEVSCMGSCMAMGSASIDCTGSCSGSCSGGCQASGGSVDCQGKCDGTCTAKAGVGTGTGAQADGTCQGSCSGTCHITAPNVKCSGTCSGSCSGNCMAGASGSVQCSGTCMGMATPISCKGGTLQGGCMVDAKCQANCNASASAKAECTPPSVTITASGTTTDSVNALITTLEKNLPNLLLVVKARGSAFGSLITTVSGSVSGAVSGSLDVGGTACLVQITAAAVSAAQDFPVALSASVSVLASVNIQ